MQRLNLPKELGRRVLRLQLVEYEKELQINPGDLYLQVKVERIKKLLGNPVRMN